LLSLYLANVIRVIHTAAPLPTSADVPISDDSLRLGTKFGSGIALAMRD